MTREQHYQLAETLLNAADRATPGTTEWAVCIQEAQVHATLAIGANVRPGRPAHR